MKMTMLGFYSYDSTIFNDLTFPVGIDKQLAIDTILIRCGEFEILYPDLDFLKFQIKTWGDKHYRTFDKWVSALAQDYEPLYNYDRTEQESNIRTIGKSNTESQNSSRNGTNNESMTDQEAVTGSSTEGVNAYDDAPGFADKSKTDTTNNASKNTSRATTIADAESIQTASNGSENETYNHTSRVFGNIGVTTSSKMLEEYLKTQRFNIYEQIADIFCDEFCILIY